MNNTIVSCIKNFFYSCGANIITLLVSMIVIAIIPKILGVEEYGYFQLYIFYTSYVIFFHFGLPYGIYLRYGGKEYQSLNKGWFGIQFWMLMIFEVFVAVIACIIIAITIGVEDKGFVLIMTCICGIIIVSRDFMSFILLATNRIKDSVKATLIDRIVFVTIVLVPFMLGVREYYYLIAADIIGKLITLIWLIYLCKDIVVGPTSFIGEGVLEALKNISAGSKIMLSNIADMLIIGILQMSIEHNWDIQTFGKISLTLSLSNLMLVFINSVSIVLFPMLRRTPHVELSRIYGIMYNILMVPLLGMMIAFYPMKQLISLWLPNYADSLTYIALLFPICVYESKMSMLVNTNLKNIRKEKWILIVNVVSVFLSLITSILTIFLLNNLGLAIVSVVFVLAFRCIFAEILLSKFMEIRVIKDIVLEMVMCILFMVTGWYIRNYWSIFLYGICYLIYILIKKKDIADTIREIKSLIKRTN